MPPETIDWFQEEVAVALKEADDPNTEWVSNEEAEATWATKRAELLKRVRGDKVSVERRRREKMSE